MKSKYWIYFGSRFGGIRLYEGNSGKKAEEILAVVIDAVVFSKGKCLLNFKVPGRMNLINFENGEAQK